MNQQTLDTWSRDEHPTVMRVSELTRTITRLLDVPELSNIRVTGEITNFKKHGSGHLYFSLSEKQGEKEFVIRCTIWKNAAKYLPHLPDDGMIVEAFGSISHYERNGQYTFIITQMWQSGAGEKALQIEKWKRELGAKGYFSPERKRSLPQYPTRIGVVTSPTGAVIHDIQNVIASRFPVEIIISPTAVQGPGAHEEIASAIKRVSTMVDLVIVGRGGGSYEDLFAFNHPQVVEMIATCPVPVIAAIGHEVDITLADLAADLRASTPSHAAELSVKDRRSELDLLNHSRNRIFRRFLSCIEQADEELNEIRERLATGRLERMISQRHQYLVDIVDRMTDISLMKLKRHRLTIQESAGRIESRNPATILIREIPQRRMMIAEYQERMIQSAENSFSRRRLELQSLSRVLLARCPYNACRDGYCMALHHGNAVRSVQELSKGNEVELIFFDGTAISRILEVKKHEEV